MCSTNICRQPSPILSTISFYSLSVLFPHPLPLSRNHTLSRTPQKSFRIRHYIHLFIMRLLLFSPYIPRLPSLVHRLSLYYILYADSTLAQHTRKYMTSTVVVLFHSFPLVGCSVRCRVLMRTKHQDCASRPPTQRSPLQPCTLARRTPGGSELPRPPCLDRQSRSFQRRC